LDGNQHARFHYVWLRDNCCCVECLHPETRERLLVTSTIPDDIAITSAELDGEDLAICWNDGSHQSRYKLDWLKTHNYSCSVFSQDIAQGEIKLWGREFQEHIPVFEYRQLLNDDEQLLRWCTSLRDYGLTIVRNAPLNEGEIERFAEFVAVVRETIYDRLHNVRATPGEYNAYNVASTTLELKPHTDMPVYNNPPGVQMFHFLVNDSEGGESTAVDGFKVAAQLKKDDPEAYRILATTPIKFKMFSDRGDVESSNPLLTLDTDGKLKVFRFSNQLAQPASMAPEKMESFYRAYRKLGRLIEAEENKVQFKLGTGDMMVTNNLRVMHGRNAYDPSTGDRHLQLSYMDMDDVMSRIRMILKKRAA
ncbi:MAG: DUF971 domain-containing protein, partial [Gammaproteobacteria bacterium]|nr:DUF971 domain-containing protein [Gammaproteobacteria bacterium]